MIYLFLPFPASFHMLYNNGLEGWDKMKFVRNLLSLAVIELLLFLLSDIKQLITTPLQILTQTRNLILGKIMKTRIRKFTGGVDSALPADKHSRKCVQNNLGDPDIWGAKPRGPKDSLL